jgi:hypothetical protein
MVYFATFSAPQITSHVTRYVWLQTGFGLVIGFVGHLQTIITNNYNSLTQLHTQEITTAHINSSQSSLPLRGRGSQRWTFPFLRDPELSSCLRYQLLTSHNCNYQLSKSELRYGRRSVGQSVFVSRPDSCYCQLCVSSCGEPSLTRGNSQFRVRVRVTLRLAVYRKSVSLGDRPLETHD